MSRDRCTPRRGVPDACSWPTCGREAAVAVQLDNPLPLCSACYASGLELGCWATATVTSLSGSLGVAEPEPAIPDRWTIPAAIGLFLGAWAVVVALVIAFVQLAGAIVG